MKKPDYKFSRKTVEEYVARETERVRSASKFRAGLLSFEGIQRGNPLQHLFDPGFILTGTYPWMRYILGISENDARDVGIISRTYVPAKEIQRSSPGTRIFILPKNAFWWGEDDTGTPILTLVTHPTKHARHILQFCADSQLPPAWLVNLVPNEPVVLHPGPVNNGYEAYWLRQLPGWMMNLYLPTN